MDKIRLHLYTYGCFLESGAKAVQFLSIKKTSIPCISYLCLNFIWKKGRGDFWWPQFALWWPKIYTWSSVGARIKKLISDPEEEKDLHNKEGRIVSKQGQLQPRFHGSTKTLNPESKNRITETETETESNINDRKLKNFTLHNFVQSKENLF